MFSRHDMLVLDDAARAYAQMAAPPLNPTLSESLIKEVIRSDIPAIVRRQDATGDAGILQVGFSSHLYREGTRVRIASAIPVNGVREIISPFDLFSRHRSSPPAPFHHMLEDLCRLATKTAVELGLYGSFALELLTGLPYTTSASDVDLCLRAGSRSALSSFHEAVTILEKRCGRHFDIELLCRDGTCLKLAELFSGQKTVLCKGLYGAELRPISQLLL